MQSLSSLVVVGGLAVALLATTAAAQDFPSNHPFPPTGESVLLGFTGAPEDFVIPSLDPSSVLRLSVKGGHGGNANPFDNHCESSGGRGAILTADFVIGSGDGELAPGGTIRFLVGQAGEEDDGSTTTTAGGGGGGSGVLYRAPNTQTWEPLLVAGGGGGAGQTVAVFHCTSSNDGVDASLTESGTSGNNNDAGEGGSNGQYGNPGHHFGLHEFGGAGGGGLYTGLVLIKTPSIPFAPDWGGAKGYPAGGAGGAGEIAGGWGCGGGGSGASNESEYRGGGGGGGYSGGGGGGDTILQNPQGGGGGGSFSAPFATVVQKAVYTGPNKDGFASLTSLGVAATCSAAIELFAEPAQTSTILVDGSFDDAIPSATFSCPWGVGNAAPDTWFSFTNDLTLDRKVTFRSLSPLFLYVEHHFQCDPFLLVACGDPSGPAGVTFNVPAGATRYFRVETIAAGFVPGTNFTMEVTFEAVGPDADGDGVPDLFDQCSGDDSLDTDQDGIPDACDGCIGLSGDDCDGNGVQDPCDLFGPPRRLALFNDSSIPAGVAVYGINGFVPSVVGDDLRVGGSTENVSFGTAVFEPVGPTAVDAFGAEFYARIDPSELPTNGLSFSVFDADEHGSDTIFGALGASSGLSLILLGPDRDVELRLDGALLAGADSPYDLDDGTWRRVEIEFVDWRVTARIAEPGKPVATVLDGVTVPVFETYRARFGFGTLSLANGADPDIFVDDVSFEDWSGVYDRDINDNGVLDACEQPESTLVAGEPANPEVLAPVGFAAPPMGQLFALGIDHSAFQPTASSDFLFVSSGQINVPLEPFGTLLTELPWLVTLVVLPGEPFEIAMPYAPQFFGVPLTFQAASFDPLASGQELLLTNALVAPIAGWHPGY